MYDPLPAAYLDALSRESAITFSPAVLVPFSGRGLRFGGGRVVRGESWRDQNGAARFTPLPGGDRLSLTLSGDDLCLPDLDALRPGATFRVTLPVEAPAILPAGVTVWTAPHDLVAGSVYALRVDGAGSHAVLSVDGRTVTVAAHADGAVAVHGLKVLDMMVREDGVSWTHDEYEATSTWSVRLEET